MCDPSAFDCTEPHELVVTYGMPASWYTGSATSDAKSIAVKATATSASTS